MVIQASATSYWPVLKRPTQQYVNCLVVKALTGVSIVPVERSSPGASGIPRSMPASRATLCKPELLLLPPAVCRPRAARWSRPRFTRSRPGSLSRGCPRSRGELSVAVPVSPSPLTRADGYQACGGGAADTHEGAVWIDDAEPQLYHFI